METETAAPEERNYRSGGNERERLEVTSGQVVVADQFILANPLLRDLNAEQFKNKALEFGAVIASLEVGTYSVLRNPYDKKVLIAPLGSSNDEFTFAAEDFSPAGDVEVDTRCLILFDAALLNDSEFIASYRKFWSEGVDGQKNSRDLVRTKGGAVRYGFSRQFEKLSVGVDKTTNERLGIWG
jgi:hypothetical protein